MTLGDIHWASQIDGTFRAAADWTGGAVPGPSDDAVLDASGANLYTVTASSSQSVDSVQLAVDAILSVTGGTFLSATGTGAGANAGWLLIADGATFQASGQMDNTGLIAVNGAGHPTSLVVGAGGLTLSGHGTVAMNDDTSNPNQDASQSVITGVSSPSTLTNVDNTIVGVGLIGGGDLTLVNDAGGSIIAQGPTPLTLLARANTIANADSSGR